ncbi:MAG: right-handed parallel beta-helix repeat-containing protein [Roseimicrobium sp.]
MLKCFAACTAFLLPIHASLHAADAHDHLSPHQRALLDSKSPPPEEYRFSFDLPAGPQFTDAEKDAQRGRGKDVMPMVRKAFEAGAAEVRIPPGDYRFGKGTWDKDGPVYALDFRGMKREAAKPFRILAHGVTFWFELPPDQAPSAHFALGFVNCSHLSLEGATLDRDPRGCMEGRITQLDEAGNRIEIEATKGTLILTSFNGKLEERLVPFNADGTFCAALYALQHRGPARLAFRSVEPGTQPGRYWVHLAEKSELLSMNRDPAWIRAYGDAGTLQVGDGLCLLHTTTTAIGVIGCTGMKFIGVRNHITKGGLREFGGGGGHLWKDCYFGPRPGTCHWQGSDGFLSGCMERGSTLDGCTMLHTTDDLINFNGLWGYVERVEGRNITLHPDSHMPAEPGDTLNFFDKQTGAPLGTANVESASKLSLTLDRDAASLANAVAENPRWQNDGWEIQNCDFRDSYQRVLIQGGNGGTLRDCRFTRIGSGIYLASNFFTRNEGGICRRIRIENNVFEDMAIHPEGVTLQAGFQSLNHAASTPLLSDLTVRGNRFINSGRYAIEFSLVSGGEISGNTFVNSGQPRALTGQAKAQDDAKPVQLKQCADIIVKDNRH